MNWTGGLDCYVHFKRKITNKLNAYNMEKKHKPVKLKRKPELEIQNCKYVCMYLCVKHSNMYTL